MIWNVENLNTRLGGPTDTSLKLADEQQKRQRESGKQKKAIPDFYPWKAAL